MPTADFIQQTLTPVFQTHRVHRAVLFGSYAKGTARENSDIDIYVESNLRGLAFFGLLEDVSAALDRPVDLIDAAQIDADSPIAREIHSTGVPIYG